MLQRSLVLQGGSTMKLRLSTLLAITVVIAPLAFSDTILNDPRAVFHPPSQIGGGGPPQSDITSTFFSFISPSGTSPTMTSPCVIGGVDDNVCDFLNLSGVDWTQLEFTVSPGGVLSSCQAQALSGFTNCDVLQQGNASTPTVFTFFGGTGIPDGTAFGFSTQGWATNTVFDVVANGAANTPEPSNMALLLGGLVFAFVLIKRTKIAKQSS
jgi:hypothetical protein